MVFILRSQALALACALSFALAGCSVFGDLSYGQPSAGLKTAALTGAYVPLDTPHLLVFERWGAAVVVAPHVAATNAHNLNMVPSDALLAVSRDYDLIFFRTDREKLAPTAEARTGQAIIAYGQGNHQDLREASGTVLAVGVHVAPICPNCAEQLAITYDAEAGPGFSGGPLVDANSGAVVGLTFGFREGEGVKAGRRMFAYPIDLVLAEMHRLLGPQGPKS